MLDIGGRDVRLTNLRKPFWAERGITKRDLLQYYATVAPVLLPHLADRAMVMKRYPNGAAGECFFMKRAPQPRPPWIETCSITHGSGNVIAFPIVQDLASLLWLVNLGCIDLNPWYARCDDVDRPDYLHFDLDPVPPATFDAVRATALVLRDALTALGMPAHVKTTGSKGVHVYVPIVRGPMQKAVWTFAKAARARAGRSAPGPDHGRIPDCEAARGPRARRLQPECVGPHARVGVFAASDAGRDRLDADHMAGARSRRDDRRLPHRQRSRADSSAGRPLGADGRPATSIRPLPAARAAGAGTSPAPMTLPLPTDYAPMEAKLVAVLPEGPQWQYEPKWDGFRCLAFKEGADVELRSKAGQPFNRYFPEIVAAMQALPVPRCVLDGELVVPQGGTLSFDELLMRIHPAESRVQKLAREHPAVYIVFDLLVDADGHAARRAPAWRSGAPHSRHSRRRRSATDRRSGCRRQRTRAPTWTAGSHRSAASLTA